MRVAGHPVTFFYKRQHDRVIQATVLVICYIMKLMLVDHLLAPSTPELYDFLTDYLRERRHVLQIAALAEITYAGRAMSTAEAGDVIIMIKPDGCFMVHTSRGVKPMNWQPTTDDIYVQLEDDLLILSAERYKPHELVRVTLYDPALVQTIALQNDTSLMLQGSEADMRVALKQNPHVIEEGLIMLDEELPTSVGDIDLYGRDKDGHFVIMELKRGKATQDAVHQLERYVSAVKQQLTNEHVRGIIVAPDVTQPAMKQLNEKQLEFCRVTALPAFTPVDLQPALFE